MDMRKVLCFNLSAARNESLDALRSLEWTIFSGIQTRPRIIDHHRFKVGIVFFGADLPNDLSSVKDLVTARHSMEWIGLLAAGTANRPDLCELISRYFHDYHTLPVDTGRLQLTLGHAQGMADMLERAAVSSPAYKNRDELIGCSPASSDCSVPSRRRQPSMFRLIVGKRLRKERPLSPYIGPLPGATNLRQKSCDGLPRGRRSGFRARQRGHRGRDRRYAVFG